MEEVGKTQWVFSAAIAFMMAIQPGQAQIFNYTAAVSGWTDTFNPYPSALARAPYCSFPAKHIERNVNCCVNITHRPL